MVRGITRREKDYVDVVEKTDEDGLITPLEITFYERDESGIRIGVGRTYTIDRVLDRRPSAALKVGGNGERYTIEVKGKTTYLFREYPNHVTEPSRWFVEAKVYG